MVIPPERAHCLRIIDQVHHFLIEQSLCDMTVHVENDQYQLHRCIFAAASPLAHNMILKAAEGSSSEIFHLKLHGITSNGFGAMLSFLYTGKVPEKSSHVRDEFMDACSSLNIPFHSSRDEKTVWLTRKDNVQVAILPKNDDSDIVEVLLQHSEEPSAVDNSLDEISFDQMEVGEEVTTVSEDATENGSEDLLKERTNNAVAAIVQGSQNDDDDVANNSAEDHSYVATEEETSETTLPEIEYKPFFCRVCHVELHPLESSSKPYFAKNAQYKEVRYNCKPCGKWYIALKGASTKPVQRQFIQKALEEGVIQPLQPDIHSPLNNNMMDISSFPQIADTSLNSGVEERSSKRYADGKIRPFHCHQCGRRFTRKHSLQCHIMELHGSTKQIVTCELCNKKYSSVKGFNHHVRQFHQDGAVQPILQNVARTNANVKTENQMRGKTPPKKKLLQLSDGTQIEQQTPFYECSLCLLRYKTQGGFLKHMEKCTVLSKFRCEHCPQGFRTKKKRSEHMKEAHEQLHDENGDGTQSDHWQSGIGSEVDGSE